MFSFDKRLIYILLGICILNMVIGLVSSPSNLLSVLLGLPAVLIAITFHEYAHAFAAYKLGDDTAKEQGRLTLNPLKHIDPIGIVMLIFLGFGWGKPVQVDSRNFNRNISMSKAEAIVSIAGPIANFILAIIFAIVYACAVKFGWFISLGIRAGITLEYIVGRIIVLNIGLGLFNLIPLPPLDGSKVLAHFLPYKAKLWFQNNEQIFYIIFLVIWITGIASMIISPAIDGVYKGLMKLMELIFKISII
jgi:Zn-dependent protease